MWMGIQAFIFVGLCFCGGFSLRAKGKTARVQSLRFGRSKVEGLPLEAIAAPVALKTKASNPKS